MLSSAEVYIWCYEQKKCPRCSVPWEFDGGRYALSRFRRDVKICSPCGTQEAGESVLPDKMRATMTLDAMNGWYVDNVLRNEKEEAKNG